VTIKPHRLEPGDTIGVIAPAGPVDQEEIQPTIDLLYKKGYRIHEAPNLFSRKGYLAGHDYVRLDDLHSMFSDNGIKAIFCARGGYGTIRILDRIDYDLILDNPKIIVGYSDITALLFAIFNRTGLVTFHGPMLRDLAKDGGDNLADFLELASSSMPRIYDLSGGMVLNHGRARGKVLGGNLSIISSLMGTPFMPMMKGAILFIEDKGEPLYRIDRMLSQLRQGGVIDGLSGLIVGRFIDCGDISDINELLRDLTSGTDIPVINGLLVGHDRENRTIPIGLHAELDTEDMTLTFLETCVA
jgi:muramoyltetrapeptide carboxypeptidase